MGYAIERQLDAVLIIDENADRKWLMSYALANSFARRLELQCRTGVTHVLAVAHTLDGSLRFLAPVKSALRLVRQIRKILEHILTDATLRRLKAKQSK